MGGAKIIPLLRSIHRISSVLGLMTHRLFDDASNLGKMQNMQAVDVGSSHLLGQADCCSVEGDQEHGPVRKGPGGAWAGAEGPKGSMGQCGRAKGEPMGPPRTSFSYPPAFICKFVVLSLPCSVA